MTRTFLIVTLIASLMVGCARSDEGSLTTIVLPYTGGNWFRLRVCADRVSVTADGERTCEEIYDTRCIEAQSQTFELIGLPIGVDRTVLFESYTAADCSPEAEVALGFRGGVDITDTKPAPYYYIPVYEAGTVTALPENINVSTSSAVQMEYCEAAEECYEVTGEKSGCFKFVGEDREYHWCVPTCEVDADCEELHPDATCDPEGIKEDNELGEAIVLAGLCMMHHPYPLNMSTPRAFGAALQGADGSVLLVGGFDRVQSGRLMAAKPALELFDAATGLFAKPQWKPTPVSRGFSGVGRLSEGRYAVVGGSQSAVLEGEGALSVGQLAGKMCTETAEECTENNLSAAVDVIDMNAGTVTRGDLPEPVVAPAVVALDTQSFVVLGGWVNEDGDINKSTVVSNKIRYCTLGEDDGITCVEMGDTMTSARVAPAATCLGLDQETGACGQVLVVGGNEGTPDADLLSFAGAAVVVTPLSTQGLPTDLEWPTFCGDVFVGGGGFFVMELDGASGVVVATPVSSELDEGVFTRLPSTAPLDTGSCWVGGGWDATGESARADILRVSADGVAPVTWELTAPRVGASAAVIRGGPLSGAVLFTGGLVPGGASGEPVFQAGAEVLYP